MSLANIDEEATKLAARTDSAMDPTQATELGSMLFTRCVSGTRQVFSASSH
jgi:hypothetical protein